MTMIENVFSTERMTSQFTSGIKFVFLRTFSVSYLTNNYQGEHITLAVGVGPFEANLGLGIWFRKQEQYHGV